MTALQRMEPRCECGHAWSEHHHVPGFECSPDVTIDGLSFVPDIWVCGGGREVPKPTDDTSPWDYVCGCLLHTEPPS